MTANTVRSTIDEYVRDGWRIEETDERSMSIEPYFLFAPDGSVYQPHDLMYGCSFCEEGDEYCVHEESLLAQEREAKHLCDLLEEQLRAEFYVWAFKPKKE